MRDLEQEVGAALFVRSVRGVELTAAGRAFLDHARLALTQAEAAAEAARRAARPAKAIFAVGFLTGQEAAWLAPATRILSDELPKIEIRVSSGFSVTLAEDLKQGRVDIAFLRHEPDPDLTFKLVLKEPLVAILPRDHRLAATKTFDPRNLAGETFIGISEIPRVLRGAVNGYLKRSGVEVAPRFGIDNFAMAMSLVTSERGVALLPISIENYLPPSIVSRRLKGKHRRSHDWLPQGQRLADSEDVPLPYRRLDKRCATLRRQMMRRYVHGEPPLYTRIPKAIRLR
jgi:LysR family transcriptional regulator, hca operon transcriptional activator